tara:strand:- start:761 stop:1000 length:240 start_codon:yes stop_codon:yes gene_type:complete
LQVECPVCLGGGCKHCKAGQFELTECPNQYIKDILYELEILDYMRDGLPPVAGGSPDQTKWVLRASKYLKYQERGASNG